MLSFSVLCFSIEDGSIYGWRTEGTFTVQIFKITNSRTNERIENIITYGEGFLFSSSSYSEYTLLFHLRNGGRIEIKFYQDKAVTEQTMLTDYANGVNKFFSEYVRRLLINGDGIFREFDRNSRLIQEKRYNSAQGSIQTYLKAESQTQRNNMAYTFFGEGIYKLLNTESETIEIAITINSPY
jgi:hypothetical protein